MLLLIVSFRATSSAAFRNRPSSSHPHSGATPDLVVEDEGTVAEATFDDIFFNDETQMSVAANVTVQAVAQNTQQPINTPSNTPSTSMNVPQNTTNDQPPNTAEHSKDTTLMQETQTTPHQPQPSASKRRPGQTPDVDKAILTALERGREREELKDRERKEDSEYHFCMHVYAELRKRNAASKKAIKRKIFEALEDHE